MKGIAFAAAAVSAACVLAGCSNPSTPPDAPTAFSVVAGDGQVIVNFDQVPNLTYWIFLAESSSITRTNYNTYLGARIVTPASNPQVVSSLANGTQYAFLVNATSGGAAGPSTSSLSATPRAAGDNYLAGPATGPANNNAIAFGILPAPAQPAFVMVGAGGAIFKSTVQTGGSVLNAQGNQPWVAQFSNVAADLNGVAWNATRQRFIAVGAGGTVITSTDGSNWTGVTAPATSTDLNAVTAYGEAFVAVGAAGTIVTSNDGLTWTTRESNTTADLLGVGYYGGVLVALGRSGTLLYSADSANWISVPVPTTADLHGFIYARPNAAASGAYYVVGALGTILTSTSPSTSWSLVAQAATTNDLYAISAGSRLVAVGKGGTAIYSDDAVTWQLANDPSVGDLYAVLYAIGVYTAVGNSGINLTSS